MDLTWPLRIAEERHDGVLVLALTGRLGAACAQRFAAGVAEAVSRGDVRMAIDLAGVDYISSAGLKALDDAAGLCVRNRGALALCGLTDPVRISLNLGGLLPALVVETSRQQAIARAATASEPVPTDES